jgi:phosphoglycolate phosphatase
MNKLVIFDLDGTLLNSIDDIADNINIMLKKFGYPERSVKEIMQFVGNGARNLMERSCGIKDYPKLDELFAAFKVHYDENCRVKTKPYAGIKELLERLKQDGANIAVLSNKPNAPVQVLIEEYFPGAFVYVQGEDEANGVFRKPNPSGLLALMKKMQATKEDTLFVGDSEVDIQTSKNAGVPCLSVTWGFKDEAFLWEHGATVCVSTAEDAFAYYKQVNEK